MRLPLFGDQLVFGHSFNLPLAMGEKKSIEPLFIYRKGFRSAMALILLSPALLRKETERKCLWDFVHKQHAGQKQDELFGS